MKNLSIKKFSIIYKKTNGRCGYCGKELDFENDFFHSTIDHIIPRCNGGTNNIENLLICCRGCNSKKGVNDLDFFRYRESCKKSNIPIFTKEQIEYLKTKKVWDFIKPNMIKFYFEGIENGN